MSSNLLYELSTIIIEHLDNGSEEDRAQIEPCLRDITEGFAGHDQESVAGEANSRRERLIRRRVDIKSLDDRTLKAWTRFSKDGLQQLVAVLGIPNIFQTHSRYKFSAFDALVILLTRLSYPCRLVDLAARFGVSESALSECINELACFITNKWAPLILDFNRTRLTAERLDLFASVISARGCPMDCIWGFIDVTIKMVCRPRKAQRELYSGYAKGHCLKYSSVVTPDGLISCCSLPLPGRRADLTCLRKSNLEAALEAHAFGVNGRRLLLWGDPAYMQSEVVASAEKEVGTLPAVERSFYHELARCRQCVEWGFGKVSNLFSFNNYSSNLKVLLSPVGAYFLCSVLFTNAHTCLYGSETSHFYALQPPSLKDYFVLSPDSKPVDFFLSQAFDLVD